MFACKPFGFLDFLYLFAHAFGISFVEPFGKGGIFVTRKAACVYVAHNGNKPYDRFGIDDFGVGATSILFLPKRDKPLTMTVFAIPLSISVDNSLKEGRSKYVPVRTSSPRVKIKLKNKWGFM